MSIEALLTRKNRLAAAEGALQEKIRREESDLRQEETDLTDELLDELGIFRAEFVVDSTIWELVESAKSGGVDPKALVGGYMSAASQCSRGNFREEDRDMETDDPMKLKEAGFAWINYMGSSEATFFTNNARSAFGKALTLLRSQDQGDQNVKTEILLLDFMLSHLPELTRTQRQYFWNNY